MMGERIGIALKAEAKCLVGAVIWAFIWIVPLEAQNPESPTFERLTSYAAINISVPFSETARYATTAWGLTYGAGFNVSRRNAVVSEIMWNSLYPTSAALAPIRAAAQNNSIKGRGNLVAFTGNYRLQFSGQRYGTYFIAGGGMYYRQASLSQLITVGGSVTCDPAWLWWGLTCSSGVVTNNQLLASSSSTALGGNVGIGFTVAIPDSRYRFYVESRYHYAPNKGVATKLIPIAIGIRF